MSKHTPGPWRVDPHDYIYVWAVGGDKMVADLPIDDDEGFIARMRGVGSGATVDEQKANARLIAQSPDLLAYVREVVADLDASQRFADMRPEYEDMLRRGLELLARVDGEGKA